MAPDQGVRCRRDCPPMTPVDHPFQVFAELWFSRRSHEQGLNRYFLNGASPIQRPRPAAVSARWTSPESAHSECSVFPTPSTGPRSWRVASASRRPTPPGGLGPLRGPRVRASLGGAGRLHGVGAQTPAGLTHRVPAMRKPLVNIGMGSAALLGSAVLLLGGAPSLVGTSAPPPAATTTTAAAVEASTGVVQREPRSYPEAIQQPYVVAYTNPAKSTGGRSTGHIDWSTRALIEAGRCTAMGPPPLPTCVPSPPHHDGMGTPSAAGRTDPATAATIPDCIPPRWNAGACSTRVAEYGTSS